MKGGILPFEQKIRDLEHEIREYKEACQSANSTPSDFTKLIDAQHALRAIKAQDLNKVIQRHSAK